MVGFSWGAATHGRQSRALAQPHAQAAMQACWATAATASMEAAADQPDFSGMAVTAVRVSTAAQEVTAETPACSSVTAAMVARALLQSMPAQPGVPVAPAGEQDFSPSWAMVAVAVTVARAGPVPTVLTAVPASTAGMEPPGVAAVQVAPAVPGVG